MRPIVCPDRKQAIAAADNPETDVAAEAETPASPVLAPGHVAGQQTKIASAQAAPLLGPRFFVGPPVAIHPNVPPKGSNVAARPGPLPRARPPFTPALPGSEIANAFVAGQGVTEATTAVSSVIAEPAAPLPRPRPQP